MSTEPEQTEDDFQKELIDLFGQEAQEWLGQIHSALAELEGQPDADRHRQLVDAVVRGITSLGGSAATVNLPDVERATFALLPFIDTVKDRTTATSQDFSTVREQFRLVVTSVTTATGLSLDLGPAQAAPPEPVVAGPKPEKAEGPSGLRKAAPFIAFGVGAAGLAVGTVFLLKNRGDRDDADAICASGRCPAARRAEVQDLDASADKAQTFSMIGYGVGAAGVIAGAVLLVLGRSSSSEPKTGLTVAPWVSASSGVLSGSF